MSDEAPCRKCDTPISTTAERCPSCSYDPTPGTLGTILFWVVALPVGGAMALTGLFGLAGTALGVVTYQEGVGAALSAIVIGALPWWYCVRHRELKRLPAAYLGGA